MLTGKFDTEIQGILARYPQDQKRSAVLPLLHLAQREYGFISRETLAEISSLVGLDPTQVGSLSSFYSLIHEQPKARRHVQICTDLPCALRGAEKFAEELCANLRIRLGEATPDGEFLVEEVTCLAGCDHAPVFQVQDRDGTHYYESESPDSPMTVEQAMQILGTLRGRSAPPSEADKTAEDVSP